MSVFGHSYADRYDALYHDKNYEQECDWIETLSKQYAAPPVKTLLDLVCGTGSHAYIFDRRGYTVTGVDVSAEMLAVAEKKRSGLEKVEFIHEDIRTLRLGKTFDVVMMMFAVLGYQYTNADVTAALRTVREHLRPGGVFIFDVWYGPAVLYTRPSDRLKQIQTARGKILRAARGSLDTLHHLARVDYHLWTLEGDRLVDESEESHQMRYFFPQELDLFCSQAGLSLKTLLPFDDLQGTPSEETWNVMGVAQG